ncbi:hypothetical protein [Corynebacterium aquatimens]|uniref:Uncharacterized protein n=1 Tax=Corynebacterium aquatimens TaxID=1190508 RepID=A0A931E2I1_9CORY|nr:hypothetical protein [Corynebacterium aquatimens]MBG6123053.1 hypothetical protein [Corynebacterium aquatimens]WJY66613.1 hypothetical protein CAQUA_09630 [Corynebacterium aquatimens]
MGNCQTKEALSEIATRAPAIPGASVLQVMSIVNATASISAKVDWTSGFNPSSIPSGVNKLCQLSDAGATLGAGFGDSHSRLSDRLSDSGEWLQSVGVLPQEQKLDRDQAQHLSDVDQLCQKTIQCIDSISTIDESANCSAQAMLEIVCNLLTVATQFPELNIGTMIASSVIECLKFVEEIFTDRNDTIGCCYDTLKGLCEEVSAKEPPPCKEYNPGGASNSPGGASKSVTPAGGTQPASASEGFKSVEKSFGTSTSTASSGSSTTSAGSVATSAACVAPQLPQMNLPHMNLPLPQVPLPQVSIDVDVSVEVCAQGHADIELGAGGCDCQCEPKCEEPPAPQPAPEPPPVEKKPPAPTTDGTFTPPPELADVKEPPPPAKKVQMTGGVPDSVPAQAPAEPANNTAPAEPAKNTAPAEPVKDVTPQGGSSADVGSSSAGSSAGSSSETTRARKARNW